MVTKENYRRPFINPSIEPILQLVNVFTFLLFSSSGEKNPVLYFYIFVVVLGGKEEETRRQTELRLTPVAGWIIITIMIHNDNDDHGDHHHGGSHGDNANALESEASIELRSHQASPLESLQCLCKKICTKILNPDYLSAVM